MDLIYIILSVFVRLSPAVRKLSGLSIGGAKNRFRDRVDLAVWVPLIGWVSVSVQQMPEAKWLTWRVREVRSFYFSPLNWEQRQSWKIDSRRHGGQLPPRPQSPDVPGDLDRRDD